MQRVESIKQTTQNKFLNMYELDMKSDTGKHSTYFVASRAKTIEELKIKTRENKADGVIIYSVYRDEKEKKEKLVLIRQYRCPLDDYIYEFPAGLVDEGEDFKMAGMRELKEETGLDSKEGQEENEVIEIVLADKAEVRRILKEENVAIMCAYMLMHFLNTPEGHVFDFLQERI